MKRNHTVYFELYGKKMKATVLADGTFEAQEAIRNKIIFHKVEDTKDDAFNVAVDMLNILGKKKP